MSGPCVTPLSDLRAGALKAYEEAASAVHSWSSVIPRAINFYFDAEEAKAAAVAPPSAPPPMLFNQYCNQCHMLLDQSETPRLLYCSEACLRAWMADHAAAPPETTAPTARGWKDDPESYYTVASSATPTCVRCDEAEGHPWHEPATVGHHEFEAASSATPTPEPTALIRPTGMTRLEVELAEHVRVLASSQQNVERLRAALESIQASGFAWAGEEGDAYGFDARSTTRIETLARIAVEALHPKSEADEMDCRSIAK